MTERKNFYSKEKIKTSYYKQIKELPQLKREKPELKEVYAQVLQEVAKRVDRAFQNFYQRMKENKAGKKQKPGYPRFKREGRYDSFTYPQNGFEIKERKLKLSKIGLIKIRPNRDIEGKIKTLTIRKTATEKWFASLLVEITKELLEKKEIKEVIGIDLELENFLTMSSGRKVENPRYLIKSEEKLAKIQSLHSRKQLKSSNRQKSKLRVVKHTKKLKTRD